MDVVLRLARALSQFSLPVDQQLVRSFRSNVRGNLSRHFRTGFEVAEAMVTQTQTGTTVGRPFGRYTLLRPIGRGGMAEVWKAKIHGAQNFQRLVVVKRILPHLSSDPEFVRMFTVEAMLSSRLSHPNIVQVFEFSEVDDEHFLAMEYVSGINLGDVIKRLGVPVPVGMAVYIVREVSLALAYAHALADDDGQPLRIIHRDVSPSNVMIGFDGGVKLLDFGVAKALSQSDEMTRTGALKGKVGYMSPEAVEGEEELDRRTDVFATGVVLHELLSGKRLFKGHDDLKTIALIRACQVEAPSAARADIPAELDRICMKALARRREERYQTADDLAADLTRVLDDLKWDAFRTATFLKENEIQAEREPDTRSGTTPAHPVVDTATMKGTVLERPGRARTVEAEAVRVGGGRRALFFAGGVACAALSIAGWKLLTGGARPANVEPVRAAAVVARPAAAEPVAPAPVLEPPKPVPAEPVAAERAEPAPIKPSAKLERRRKPPRRAAPPVKAPPASDKPSIDLKRGDVLKTF